MGCCWVLDNGAAPHPTTTTPTQRLLRPPRTVRSCTLVHRRASNTRMGWSEASLGCCVWLKILDGVLRWKSKTRSRDADNDTVLFVVSEFCTRKPWCLYRGPPLLHIAVWWWEDFTPVMLMSPAPLCTYNGDHGPGPSWDFPRSVTFRVPQFWHW